MSQLKIYVSELEMYKDNCLQFANRLKELRNLIYDWQLDISDKNIKIAMQEALGIKDGDTWDYEIGRKENE